MFGESRGSFVETPSWRGEWCETSTAMTSRLVFLLILPTTDALILPPATHRPPLRCGAVRCSVASSKELLKAARNGDADALNQLLSDGLDLADEGVGGMALHVAAGMGHDSIVQALLAAGVSPTAVEKGVTALHTASFKNRAAVVDTLLEAGADPNAAQMSDGSTALLEAAVAGHAPIVERLLAAGADPDRGASAKPLPSAAIKNHVGVVRLLLDGGLTLCPVLRTAPHRPPWTNRGLGLAYAPRSAASERRAPVHSTQQARRRRGPEHGRGRRLDGPAQGGGHGPCRGDGRAAGRGCGWKGPSALF